MLGRVIEDTWLVDDVGKVFRVAWRKAIVPASFDVEEFIQRVSVGQPGSSFLVSAEKIAGTIEG